MRRALILAALLLPTSAGCMGLGDIFNRSTADLSGGYCLSFEREFKSYRIDDCSGKRKVDEGVGILEGTIKSVGWNEHSIVAWRWSCCHEGDGFMIIDVASGRIDGPFSEEQLGVRSRSDDRLRGIRIRPATEVLR